MRRVRILGGLLLLACARKSAPTPAEADPASGKERRVQAARAELPVGTGAIVDSPPSFNDEFAIRVTDGLSQAGFRDIAFEVRYR